MSRHCLDAPEVLATGGPDSLTDITEIKTQQGKLSLCIVRYLYDQRVLGWSMHDQQDRQILIRAVQMAVWQRQGSHESCCSRIVAVSSAAATTRDISRLTG